MSSVREVQLAWRDFPAPGAPSLGALPPVAEEIVVVEVQGVPFPAVAFVAAAATRVAPVVVSASATEVSAVPCPLLFAAELENFLGRPGRSRSVSATRKYWAAAANWSSTDFERWVAS